MISSMADLSKTGISFLKIRTSYAEVGNPDVYKRQTVRCRSSAANSPFVLLFGIPRQIKQPAKASKPNAPTECLRLLRIYRFKLCERFETDPVSYTHLDVYKRQPQTPDRDQGPGGDSAQREAHVAGGRSGQMCIRDRPYVVRRMASEHSLHRLFAGYQHKCSGRGFGERSQGSVRGAEYRLSRRLGIA